jgi:ribulose-phosphate 3-epimerase
MIQEIIDEIDLVLIMTVEPGFGGQHFIKNTLRKIRETREIIDRSRRDILLEVDGGIDQNTARSVIEAGANVLVAGTSIFKVESIKKAITSIRTAQE